MSSAGRLKWRASDCAHRNTRRGIASAWDRQVGCASVGGQASAWRLRGHTLPAGGSPEAGHTTRPWAALRLPPPRRPLHLPQHDQQRGHKAGQQVLGQPEHALAAAVLVPAPGCGLRWGGGGGCTVERKRGGRCGAPAGSHPGVTLDRTARYMLSVVGDQAAEHTRWAPVHSQGGVVRAAEGVLQRQRRRAESRARVCAQQQGSGGGPCGVQGHLVAAGALRAGASCHCRWPGPCPGLRAPPAAAS